MKQRPKFKRPPKYFWDFQWNKYRTKIISVQVFSDDTGFPLIKEFLATDNVYPDPAVVLAEQLVDDLKSGRITIKR